MVTLTNLIDKVTERISLVSGTGVQLYAEDRIADMIQHKFDILFSEEWWPQFLKWRTTALDGTLGVLNEDVSAITYPIKEFDDIRLVFIQDKNPVIKKLPTTINPDTLTGTTAIYYEPFEGTDAITVAQRIFQIRPKTATGSLTINYRSKPDDFVAADTVDFDKQALILGAAWDYLEDDGANPSASEKMQGMFESRVQQLKRNLHSGPVALDVTATNPDQFEFVAL